MVHKFVVVFIGARTSTDFDNAYKLINKSINFSWHDYHCMDYPMLSEDTDCLHAIANHSMNYKITYVHMKYSTNFMAFAGTHDKYPEGHIEVSELEDMKKTIQRYIDVVLQTNNKGEIPLCEDVYAFDVTTIRHWSDGNEHRFEELLNENVDSIASDIEKKLNIDPISIRMSQHKIQQELFYKTQPNRYFFNPKCRVYVDKKTGEVVYPPNYPHNY